MKKDYSLITVIFTALCIVVLPVLLIVMPKKTFSDNENRNLAQLPELSLKAISSGQYMDDINDYLTDQFPFRDFWISMKTGAELITGKKQINGIYIAADDYLIGSYDNPENTDTIKEKFKAFNESIVANKADLNVKLMLVPTSITINSDLMPKGAVTANQMDTIATIEEYAGIDTIDVYDTLMAHKEQQLFYRTDHHWTTLGAYYAYLEYCKANDIQPAMLDEYKAEDVTEDFHGTYSSKVNRFGEKGDSIRIYTHPDNLLTVEYLDTEEISDSLYELSYTEAKDKYSLFLNNLHPLVVITNENAESDSELMIVKDSYANSIIPFLVKHYSKIYVFDCRYYREGPSNFVKDHPEITDVLILYNLSTLDKDTGIRGIY